MIFVAAWTSLGIALLLTLWVVVLLVRVIRTGLDINRLAARVLPAAQGIAGNTESIAELEATPGVAGELLGATQSIDQVSATIEQGVGTLAQAIASGRGTS